MSFHDTLKLIQLISDKYLIDKPYIVGGLPRDLYLGIPNVKTTDLDITTNSSDVLRLGILVSDELNVTFELSDDGHLTVFAEKFDLDFSSHFVSEKVVEFLKGKHKGLEEAFSRDFTINTLHQDLTSGEILDPTGLGFKDIENKLIKTPVPPEITLTDDPRRVYRAINLAVRYNFKISDDIVDFVINNPQHFTSDKIKDKYIAIKINKSLDVNPKLTIDLLKKLKLFKNVPLSGKFKEILIKDKMLADYLSNQNKKVAFKLAKNWDDYEEQGLQYSALKDWWKNNANKLPGRYNSSYLSWEKWYMEHYRGPWNFKHKNPDEVLNILQNEITQPDPFGLLEYKDESRSDNFEQFSNVNIKPGVDIVNVTNDVKYFIKVLGEEALKLGVETPVITSGWRSIEEQAKIMAKNWKDNGGNKSGRRYLINLYGEDYGGKVSSIFEKYGTNEDSLNLVIQVIKKQPIGSSHILNPGKAIDLRMTTGIMKVLRSIVQQKIFDMKIKDESSSVGAHYHITINGIKSRKNGILERKKEIIKIINY